MSVLCNLVLLGVLVASIAVFWQWRSTVDINGEHRQVSQEPRQFYKGKRVIVTGASKGIGRTLAIQLAQLGAKVVIAARSEDKLAEVQKECQQYSAHVHTVVADVSKEEDCRSIVEKTVSEFGGIDILILNAAYIPTPTYFEEYENPADEASRVLSVNYLQSIHLVQMSLSHLKKSKGHIVAVSSAAGFFKSLNQEFIITNVPVSITIIPVPFVLTEKAVENWKPKDQSYGITPEDCSNRMLTGIAQRKLFYYLDWTTFITAHIYSLSPELIDYLTRIYLPSMSEQF